MEGRIRMINELIDLIKDTFCLTDEEVTEDTAFKIDLDLDSFEIINLICILEDTYNITINEMDIVSLVTVSDLYDYIELKK